MFYDIVNIYMIFLLKLVFLLKFYLMKIEHRVSGSNQEM